MENVKLSEGFGIELDRPAHSLSSVEFCSSDREQVLKKVENALGTFENAKAVPPDDTTPLADFDLSDDELLTLLDSISKPGPLKKRKRKSTGRASVTEFSQISWCELQHYYQGIFGKPIPTESMLNGVERHYELEQEVHTLVKVKTKTKLDSWGLKLYDALSRIHTFKKKGVAREVRVFGFLKLKGHHSMVLTMGIIDLLQRKDGTAEHSGCEAIRLVDNKTRIGKSLPSEKQSKSQKLQMMLYKKMLDDLISCGKKAAVSLKELPATYENIASSLRETELPADEFFDALGVDYNGSFSDVFLDQLSNLKAHRLIRSSKRKAPITILEIFRALLLSLSNLPYCSPELTLKYEHQKSQSFIGEVNFSYDPTGLDEHIQKSLEYLLNTREPKGVTDVEEAGYKCGNCSFAENCDWREAMAEHYSRPKQ
ncbi:hypothetical protein DSO57_1019040 [Entomophthora muscae]|uniref:Uncharacterized protein n=1 Tax=Entomophthora muscae TaxID=34485 RepID=A0ACC2SH50_9FUNG|nr:hypothetical protein DSO57_1019040 [Entomophthora muscae]